MASIKYDDVFSRFFTKVEAYDFLYEQIKEETAMEFMTSWLHAALAYPHIRRVFKELSVDDDTGEITYTMDYEIDEFSDTEFVKELLANAVLFSWLQPKVNSITTITMNFATSDSKFYSQSQHLNELRQLLSDAESRIRSLTRDRGYLYNTWLDGKK